MKNIILTIIIVSSILVWNINAQAQWGMFGNTLTGTQYFGSNNNFPLNFYTNGSQVMTLSTTGDLELKNTTAAYFINGFRALWNNGNPFNIYVGALSGNSSSVSTSNNNTFVGAGSGQFNKTGSENCFMGFSSGFSNTSESYNTFVGSWAGYNNQGANNTFIGNKATSDSTTICNAVAIGSQAKVNIDNGFVLGTEKTNVGIRTTTPQYALEVRGTIAAEKIVFLNDKNEVENLKQTITDLQNDIALLKQEINKLQIQLTAKN